jgi:formylmethanofuran dehydrogenase subunit A
MDREYRHEVLQSVHPVVREQSLLRNLTREYTLNEVAIITRAAPARMLGLSHKGHLGPGADADITIYAPQENKESMFAIPRYVIKSGQVVVEEGQPSAITMGKTIHADVRYDQQRVDSIARWFDSRYSIRFGNYRIQSEELRCAERHPC